MRLVGAEFLKLYRRTGIVLAALGLTVVPALIMMAVTGDGADGRGGMRAFNDQFGVLAMLCLVSGILVGAMQGTADVTSGVFRDLVVTGRSRLDLYAARVPAGLVLVLVAAAGGFAIVVATSFISAGTVPAIFEPFGTEAPETGVLVKSGLWLALTSAVGFALAFGVASVVGSPGGSIAILLALWLVVTPLLQSFDEDGWLFKVLVISGLDRLMPAGMQAGDPETRMSLVAGIAVLLAWTAVPLLAGAWRTMTRDA
jgi:ABC-2 family transporter